MTYLLHLKCRDCGRTYPAEPLAACEQCWAPLEPVYDYTRIWSDVPRRDLELRAPNMWRYRELLPLDGEPCGGPHTGVTPLYAAPGRRKASGAGGA